MVQYCVPPADGWNERTHQPNGSDCVAPSRSYLVRSALSGIASIGLHGHIPDCH